MDATGKEHLVRIHIDRQEHKSPTPTTGQALYTLGNVAHHRELFREVGGDHEDELISRDAVDVHLKEDEHFYSQRAIDIIVNGEKKEVVELRLSFDEVVKLAYPTPPAGQNIMFTITYRKGPPKNPKGDLLEGETVRVKNGMIFDVTPTDRS
jgi:hypothetical protein